MSEARRTGKRFPLSLPITIKGQKPGKLEQALTQNVSAAGVYINADTRMDIGSNVEFEITLPAEIVGTNEDVQIHCKGHVVRMDGAKSGSKNGKNSKSGMACVIDHYKFVRKK